MLTDVYHGKIPSTVITPAQLKRQLTLIGNTIPHNLMVPGEQQDIAHLYSLLTAKVKIIDDNLIVQIKVPLLNLEFFKLRSKTI